MIKFLIFIFLLYMLFLKIYKTLQKYKENYKNRTQIIHKFKVNVADNDKKRAKGLMFIKKKLPKNNGMLFDFKKPKHISLWMKNTFIPLDVLFFDENRKIVDLKKNMIPHNTKSYKSKVKCRYALEINANTINTNNIKIGDYVELKKL